MPLAGWDHATRWRLLNGDESEYIPAYFKHLIRLTSDNFDFAEAQADGDDIRITADEAGATIYPHFIEHWDAVGEVGVIRVAYPGRIPPGEARAVYIQYGNDGASSTSDWESVFQGVRDDPADIYGANEVGAEVYNAFPAFVIAANGDWVVAFRAGATHLDSAGKIRISISDDDGATWTHSVAVDAASVDDRVNIGMVVLTVGENAGRILLPYLEHDGTEPTVTKILKSDDNGATWSAHATVATLLTDWQFPYGQIRELSNGDLLMPCYGEVNGDTENRSVLLKSTDGGLTWSLHGTIAGTGASNGYNETSIITLDSESNLLAVCRTTNAPPKIFKVSSTDGGATWGSATELFADGVSPNMTRLNSGAILLSVGDRVEPTLGIRSYLSYDHGVTWSDARHIITGTPSAGQNLSYPAAAQLSTGRIFLVYYYEDSRGEDNTTIAGVEFDEQWLLSADNLLEDNEDNSTADWAVIAGTTTAISTNQPHRGTYGMRINDADAGTLNRAIRALYSTAEDFAVVGFWMRFADLAIFPGFGLLDGTAVADRRFWLGVNSSGVLQWLSLATNWTSFSPSIPINENQWYHFILLANHAANTCRLILDGDDKGTFGRSNAGSAITHIEFASGSTAGTGDDFYFDDIYTAQPWSDVWPTAEKASPFSGTVTMSDGSLVEGATVYIINTTDEALEGTATTDASGEWIFDVSDPADNYAAMAAYESGGTQYTALGHPFLTID